MANVSSGDPHYVPPSPYAGRCASCGDCHDRDWLRLPQPWQHHLICHRCYQELLSRFACDVADCRQWAPRLWRVRSQPLACVCEFHKDDLAEYARARDVSPLALPELPGAAELSLTEWLSRPGRLTLLESEAAPGLPPYRPPADRSKRVAYTAGRAQLLGIAPPTTTLQLRGWEAIENIAKNPAAHCECGHSIGCAHCPYGGGCARTPHFGTLPDGACWDCKDQQALEAMNASLSAARPEGPVPNPRIRTAKGVTVALSQSMPADSAQAEQSAKPLLVPDPLTHLGKDLSVRENVYGSLREVPDAGQQQILCKWCYSAKPLVLSPGWEPAMQRFLAEHGPLCHLCVRDGMEIGAPEVITYDLARRLIFSGMSPEYVNSQREASKLARKQWEVERDAAFAKRRKSNVDQLERDVRYAPAEDRLQSKPKPVPSPKKLPSPLPYPLQRWKGSILERKRHEPPLSLDEVSVADAVGPAPRTLRYDLHNHLPGWTYAEFRAAILREDGLDLVEP